MRNPLSRNLEKVESGLEVTDVVSHFTVSWQEVSLFGGPCLSIVEHVVSLGELALGVLLYGLVRERDWRLHLTLLLFGS